MSFAQKITGKLSKEETSAKAPEKALKEFIAVRVPRCGGGPGNFYLMLCATTTQEDPNSVYTFDSERDAPQSEFCREGKERDRKCIMVRFVCAVLSCLC